MTADPKVRKDGKCALASCRKPRKLTKQARMYAGHHVDLDPFCGAPCCRKWHGCELASDSDGRSEQRAEAGRAGADYWRAANGG